MPPFLTEAVILRLGEFQERDLLVTFYGDQKGKMTAVAKGAKASRRRFGANLDLLSYVRVIGFERSSNSLARMEGADLLEHFPWVRENLAGFARACYLAEWVDGCAPERQPVPGLLPLVLWTLRSFGKGRAEESALRLFELRALDLAGYGPALDRCVVCGSKLGDRLFVSVDVARGGALCGHCAHGSGIRISKGTVRLLQEARSLPLERLHRIAFSSLALRESRELMGSFFTYHVGRELRSCEFMKSMGAWARS